MTTSTILDLTGTLNGLAKTKNLGKVAAANIWAGLPPANGLGLLGALNVKAGNGSSPAGWQGLGRVCNQLAGTKNLEPLQALQLLLAAGGS